MDTTINFTSPKGKVFAARLLLTLMLIQVFQPVAMAYEVSNHRISVSKLIVESESRALNRVAKYSGTAEAKAPKMVVNLQSKGTGGPGSQKETSTFSLNTNSDLVDPFTGDFSYSIPLMDVEGYPIVLSYNSNIGMLDEASWVGLGWSLNVGSVSREKRGIPDEFDGTQNITSIHNQKPDQNNGGIKNGFTGGFFYHGLPNSRISKLGLDVSVLSGSYTNTYTGMSRTFDLNISPSLEVPFGSDEDGNQMLLPVKFGFGYNRDDKNGIGRSTTTGLSDRYVPNGDDSPVFGMSYSSNYSTRAGVVGRGFSLSTPIPYSGYVLGAHFTCGTMTYVPRVSYNTINKHVNTTTDLVAGFMMNSSSRWGMSAGYEHQDYSSTQTTKYTNSGNIINSPAFGYFYSDKCENYTGTAPATMDFNREHDAEFSENMKNLPYAFATYDVFYVNGGGIGGTFRGQRNDIGVYKDATVKSETFSTAKDRTLGTQIYATESPSLILGYVQTEGDGDTKSGRWVDGGEFFHFGDDGKVSFKGIGEPTPKLSNLLDQVGGVDPSALVIERPFGPPAISKTDQLATRYNDGSIVTTTLNLSAIEAENKADKRAMIYRPLTPSQISYPAINIYNENTFFGTTTSGTFTRVDANHLANHISGVEVINTSGMKYFYGLPVYSKSESEVGFSTNNTDGDSQGLTHYTSTGSYADNSVNNIKGMSNYYDKTTTPSYATSFLLTHVFSDDYVDISSNGPSLDDPGNYYQFNYSRLFSSDNPYQWRMPYQFEQAFFNENLLSLETDNMAMYTYGEKEIWYTHSIESKNMVAEFTISNREDAYAVAGENGGMNVSGKTLKKLDKITLYNRSERLEDGVNAKPIMTVELIYNYSLCPGNPANSATTGTDTGKLTLLEIRVYNGPVSQETALAPIKFTYGSGANNPSYHYKATDRWGVYKPDNDASKPLEIYPYAEQEQTTADANCKAWKLIKIESPGGSSMDIDYASDHYAFVQNRRAMDMMKVNGFMTQFELDYLLQQSTWDGSTYVGQEFHKNLSDGAVMGLMGLTTLELAALKLEAAAVYANLGGLNDKAAYAQLDKLPANVVVFELDQAVSGATKAEAEKNFRDQYLKQYDTSPNEEGYIDEVYFRSMVQIKEGYTAEMIPTFAQVKKAASGNIGDYPYTGLLPKVGDAYKYGYIVLENVKSTEDRLKVHLAWTKDPILMQPLEKAAMEFARLNLAEIVYLATPSQSGVHPVVDNGTFWTGDVYQVMQKYHFCEKIIKDLPSQIRLFDSDNIKFGGGSYVKSIVIHDNWDVISGEYKSSYGTYWLRGPEDRPSSYGVAAYEPSVGGDENSFYAWDRYTNRAVAFPDQSAYNISPVGESLYPTPVIGYKQVKVLIQGTQNDVEGTTLYTTATNRDGYSIMQFYTAYDYPTVSRSTLLQKQPARNFFLTSLNEVDLYGLSQGHLVISNDFHGQPKQFDTYDQFDVLQSTVRYKYKKTGATVKMLDRTGTLSDGRIAMESDVMVDSRFISNVYQSLTLGVNAQFKLPLFTPGIPIPVFNYSRREIGFYSHVINKHVNYSAILESVETTTMGSTALAENQVYDKETGQVVLSTLNDEFNDKLYSFSYPAHWYYTLFRSPLEYVSPVVGNMSGNTLTTSSQLVDQLTVGDKVSITNGTLTIVSYVLSVDGLSVKFIDNGGNAFTGISGHCTVTVTESGRKNILGAGMQSVVTKRNPLNVAITTFTFPSADIIQAGAITFRPRLNTLCSATSGEKNVVKSGNKINPFAYGLLNNLLPEHSYTPQLELSSTATQGLRFNSVYLDYYSFYKLNSSGYWSQIDESTHPDADLTDLKKWRPSSEIMVTDEIGRPIESKDPIDVSSAILYGYNKYNKLVPVAQATNAQQNEIAYESFDDHNYMHGSDASSIPGHFNYVAAIAANPTVLSLSSTYRHSGVSSMKITGSGVASVTSPTMTFATCNELDEFTGSTYVVSECMCVKPFQPYVDKDYLVSVWVKGGHKDASGNYDKSYVKITYTSSGTTEYAYATGQVIDGWQRIEKTFTIPSSATEIIVTLQNDHDAGDAYFDDLRIQPFQAGMTTTVYDPETLLPMATHDGYNFTTFYGYDENLTPVRVRVETINGIQTITEQDGSTYMQFKN